MYVKVTERTGVIQFEVAFSVDLGGSSNYSNEKFEDRSRERFQANVVRT